MEPTVPGPVPVPSESRQGTATRTDPRGRGAPRKAPPQTRPLAVLVLAAVALLGAPASWGAAPGESYVELYGGAAWTSDDTVEAEVETLFFPFGTSTRRGEQDVEFDPTWLVGARYTRFWGPVGVGADLWYYAPETDGGVDVWLAPLSLLLYLRKGLWGTAEIPDRVEGYLGAGLSLVTYGIEGRFRNEAGGAQGDEFRVDEVDVDAGVDLRVGLRYRVSRGFHLFSEYRYLHADLSSEPEDDYWWSSTAKAAGFTLRSQFAVFGVGWAFR